MYPFWTWFGYAVNESVHDFELHYLPINFAFLLVDKRLGTHLKTTEKYSLNDVGVYTKSSECVSCPFTLVERLNNDENKDLLDDYYVWKMKTVGYSKWRILGSSLKTYNNAVEDLICEFEPGLGEFGVYKLDLDNCRIKVELEPINIYLQLIVFCVLFSISVIFLTKYFMKEVEKHMSPRSSPAKDESHSGEDVALKRIETGWLSSLHIFRGFLLCLLMFLTTGGGGYFIFTKNMGGITFAELLFFAYIWTIGFKIPISMNRVFERNNAKKQAFLDVIKVSSLLVGIGFVTENLFQNRTEERSIALWCSLQRLGITYFFVGTTYIFTAKKFETNSKNIIRKVFDVFKSSFWCWVIVGYLLILQTISINFVITFEYPVEWDLETTFTTTVPSITYEEIGSPEEGTELNNSLELSDDTDFYNKVFIGSNFTMSKDSYVVFSKGLIGIMTTIIICIFGIPFGTIYLQNEESKDKIMLWSIWTMFYAIVGVSLATLSLFLHIYLWSFASTFLITAWVAIFFLHIYGLVEFTKKMSFPLIRRIGALSLFLFIGHSVVTRLFPLHTNTNHKSHLMILFQSSLIILHWFTMGIFFSIKNYKFGIEL